MIRKVSYWNILLLVIFLTWISIGIFYVFYTGAIFDEGNVLYKSFLYVSGAAEPYSKNSSWTEYMPGGFIFYGVSQVIFGKSFYVARLIPFLFGLFNFFLCFYLAKKLAGNVAATLTLFFIVTNSRMVQSFSNVAVYSFSVFFLLLFFITIVSKLEIRVKSLFSILFLFMAAFFRSSLLPNYLLGSAYIFYLNRQSIKNLIMSILTFILVPLIMIYPFIPGIFHIFLQLPLVRTVAVKFGYPEIFFYSINNFDLTRVMLSTLEFLKFHQVWFVFLFAFLILPVFSSGRKAFKSSLRNLLKENFDKFLFLIIFFLFNLIVHYIGAYGHCPKCSIAYFYYYSFAGAIIIGVMLSALLAIVKGKVVIDFIFLISMLYILYIGSATLYNVTLTPFNNTTLQITQAIADDIKKITLTSDKIFTITEPHYLFLSDRRGFGPLINKEYGLRLSNDSKTLSEIGFWNVEMAEKWIEEADWALVDENNLLSLKAQGGEKVYNRIFSKIKNNYSIFKTYEDAWPGRLYLYKKRTK